MAGFLCFSQTVWAAPFPVKTADVVQDENKSLNETDVKDFTETLKQIQGEYKVVVVDSTEPEAKTADEYAQKLYDNYNLSDEALMIVLDMNTQELGVYAGPALQEKGASAQLIDEKIESFYEPYRAQKEYLKGVQLFITELNNELGKQTSAASTPAANPEQQPQQPEASSNSHSLWSILPWWLYLIGLAFIVLLLAVMYAFVRRRQIFAEVDEVEDWKDELVEKINLLQIEKSLRRARGATEEKYIKLANRKEDLLRVKIPDVEMAILDAEEACDRFRFQLAVEILDEARDLLTEVEAEFAELKDEAGNVVQAKNENKVVVPELGRLFETVERKLSNIRLEYGLPFHELKQKLDVVEKYRQDIKRALADGDEVAALEMTEQAQSILGQLGQAMEQIPELVALVHKTMPEKFKQLEQEVTEVTSEGYDLNETSIDSALLQAKQLVTAAQNALEEGGIELVKTHAKAFDVQLETLYGMMEKRMLVQGEVAATSAYETAELASGQNDEPEKDEQTVLTADAEPQADAHWENPPLAAQQSETEDLGIIKQKAAEQKWQQLFADYAPEAAETLPIPEQSIPDAAADDQPSRLQPEIVGQEENEGEDEYELVIPKKPESADRETDRPETASFRIATEDDAYDELERISSALIRIRQQIKRSYLPGVPDQLKFLFEEIVQVLALIKKSMERVTFDLEEVGMLLDEAGELLTEIETLSEQTIADCQRAEGAIQYTNRYRRQNRQVNELLTKAEQAFRQLLFREALQLAEEARLVIEGEPEEPERGWILRKKKKGTKY
nr:septation ring formation regulator EzrA [Brevibacillus fulvus]